MKKINVAQLCLRVNPSVRDWLFVKAEAAERSMNWVVSKILEQEMLKDIEEKGNVK